MHLSKGLCTGLALQKTESFQKHSPLPSAADLTHARTAQAVQAPPPPPPPQGPSRVGIAVLLGAGLLLLATWHKLTSRSSSIIYSDASLPQVCIRASLPVPASGVKQPEASHSMFKVLLRNISAVWIKLRLNLSQCWKYCTTVEEAQQHSGSGQLQLKML